MRPLRSVLFLPASNPRAIEKARGLSCDAVVLDLEDAVAPEEKAEARARMVETLAAGGFGGRLVAVRVNGLDTEWGKADLAATAEAGPDAVVAPKVSSAGAVADYDRELSGASERTRLWAMIETCAGVLDLAAIAACSASTRLSALVVGVNDLSKEMRCRPAPGRDPLKPALALTVMAARGNGLYAIDGVFNSIEDAEGLEAECAQGRVFGFDGKSLIHPSQIHAAERAFAPDAAELAWAEAVVEAFDAPENAGKGAIRLQGRMVERLHLDEARRVIASAGLATSR
jgi:citrate lyase subunit beta/citryl-CoA lyase